jgi:hypothetical protein
MATRSPEAGILVHGFAPYERAFALDCLMSHGLDLPPDALIQLNTLLAAAHMYRFVKKVRKQRERLGMHTQLPCAQRWNVSAAALQIQLESARLPFPRMREQAEYSIPGHLSMRHYILAIHLSSDHLPADSVPQAHFTHPGLWAASAEAVS